MFHEIVSCVDFVHPNRQYEDDPGAFSDVRRRQNGGLAERFEHFHALQNRPFAFGRTVLYKIHVEYVTHALRRIEPTITIHKRVVFQMRIIVFDFGDDGFDDILKSIMKIC